MLLTTICTPPRLQFRYYLSSNGIRAAYYSCLNHSRVLHQCVLHFWGPNPVPVEKPVFQRRLDTPPLAQLRSLESDRIKNWITLFLPRNQAYPLELMISSVLPMNWKYPSWSLIARSPRTQKSPLMLASVFSRLSWWSQKDSHYTCRAQIFSPRLAITRCADCSFYSLNYYSW